VQHRGATSTERAGGQDIDCDLILRLRGPVHPAPNRPIPDTHSPSDTLESLARVAPDWLRSRPTPNGWNATSSGFPTSCPGGRRGNECWPKPSARMEPSCSRNGNP
jgi:hypothetical protein